MSSLSPYLQILNQRVVIEMGVRSGKTPQEIIDDIYYEFYITRGMLIPLRPCRPPDINPSDRFCELFGFVRVIG